jgi:transposase
MKLHRNARTCPRSRQLIVERVLEQGWTLARAGEAAGVSVRTVSKWLRRYRVAGAEGLLDRVGFRNSAADLRRLAWSELRSVAAVRRPRVGRGG